MTEPGTENLLVVVRLGAPHGLKGVLRGHVLIADAKLLLTAPLASRRPDGAAGPLITVVKCQLQARGQALLTLAGVDDRTAAEQLTGLTLLLPREQLPPAGAEEVYLHDLLHRAVHDAAGILRGQVTGLQEAAGKDLLEITVNAGGKKLVPAHAEFFTDLRADPLVLNDLGEQVLAL